MADGFEDVEAVTPIDYLRRAGIEVTSVSISGSSTVTGRWGEIKLICDSTLEAITNHTDFDAVILPAAYPAQKALQPQKKQVF